MNTHNHTNSAEIIIIGGGLGGLVTATLLAQSGRSVMLFEKARHFGGRAITKEKKGFNFNLGPHALYMAGAGMKILRELEIEFSGGKPKLGGYAIKNGQKHHFPGKPHALLTTSLLSWKAKLEMGRVWLALSNLDTAPLQKVTLKDWLTKNVHHEEVRQFLTALFRLFTYANDITNQSAGAVLAQAKLAISDNVLYVDGGWQTLVDGVRQAAERAGVQLVIGASVKTVAHKGQVTGIHLTDGTFYKTSTVVIAASPQIACKIVEGSQNTVLQQWANNAIPVKAACLDVGLRYLPQLNATFALGVDQPLYLSVHSAVAELALTNSALIHATKYLSPDEASSPEENRRDLENLLDLVQPGWRDVLLESQFLPEITVSYDTVIAQRGGLPGRAGPTVPGIENLYVVGDWVGPTGLLSDASLASAKLAAELILSKSVTTAPSNKQQQYASHFTEPAGMTQVA